MSTTNIKQDLIRYWHEQNVMCQKASIGGELSTSELGDFWASVGMPDQSWWLFRFTVPTEDSDRTEASFGTSGTWHVFYRRNQKICFARDELGNEHFANSSFAAFMRLLMLFDVGCKKIQKECPGDSGADEDRADAIINEMRDSMLSVDPRALEDSKNLWPQCLFAIRA